MGSCRTFFQQKTTSDPWSIAVRKSGASAIVCWPSPSTTITTSPGTFCSAVSVATA